MVYYSHGSAVSQQSDGDWSSEAGGLHCTDAANCNVWCLLRGHSTKSVMLLWCLVQNFVYFSFSSGTPTFVVSYSISQAN